MPRSVASAKTSTPNLRQRRFPQRRHIAQPRRSLLGSEKERRQSSLTQLDFLSTPLDQDEIIQISSDHDDSDFEEPQLKKRQRLSKGGHASERRSGKKRASMKLPKSRDDVGESQHTFTQMPYLRSGSKTVNVQDEDDAGFDMYADDGRDRYTALSKDRRPLLPWRDEIESSVKAQSSQTSAHTTLDLPVLDTPNRRYNLRSPPKKPSTAAALSSHNIAAHDFTTPKKKILPREIPSSQTPPSTKLSIRHTQRSQPRAGFQRSPLKKTSLEMSPLREKSQRRSPLKEKSTNMPIAKAVTASPKKWMPRSPESQNLTMKLLERTRLRTRTTYGDKANGQPAGSPPRRETSALPKEQAQVGAETERLSIMPEPSPEEGDTEKAIDEAEPTPASGQMAENTAANSRKRKSDANQESSHCFAVPEQPAPRKLKRTATVQDTQDEGLSWPTPKIPRKLKRVNTVQDSQHEDLDMSSSIYRSISNEQIPSGETQQGQQYETLGESEEANTWGTMEPQTYDPAYAALDRDAARFGWTQTQAIEARVADSVAGSPGLEDDEETSKIHGEEQEEEEDEDDLDRGVIPASDDEDDEIIILSSSGAGTSQELGSDPPVERQSSKDEVIRSTPPGPALDTEYAEPSTNDMNPVSARSPSPPSSPPIHPSQISTVVPTQRSMHPSSTMLRNEAISEEAELDEEEEQYSPPTSPPAPIPPPITAPKRQSSDSNDLPQRAATLTNSALTLSSSPLPLPPWTSDNAERWDGSSPRGMVKKDNGKHCESLLDFSLPPPPPMLRTSSPFGSGR